MAGLAITVNFQPAGAPADSGSLIDAGETYGDRGNAFVYGWHVSNVRNTRDRNLIDNQRLDTVAFMQIESSQEWEIALPNGNYEITLGSGDAKYRDGVHDIWAEGQRVMYGIQSSRKQFLKATRIIAVTDGTLTLTPGPSAINAKINYVTIRERVTLPTVTLETSDGSATEGGDGGLIHVKRTGSLDLPLSVDLAWSGSAGSKDIASRPYAVTIGAGQSALDINVTPIDDDLEESLETARVAVVASPARYLLGAAYQAAVFIIGSEPPLPTVIVEVFDGSTTEGSDTALARFTRTGSTSKALRVDFAWSGSADEDDIVAITRSIEFPIGATSTELTIAAADDVRDEPTETLVLTIQNVGAPRYFVGTPGNALFAVMDNDAPTQAFTNITWAPTSAPPVSLAETTSITHAGKIYLFGGFNSSFVPQKCVYAFDGTNWTTLANAPKAFTQVGRELVDDTIWFAGGYIGKDTGGQTFGTTDVMTFDTLTQTWGTGPSLPEARAAGNLVKIGRTLFFLAGESANRAADVNTMWALDLDNQAAGWATRASLPLARNRASALNVNGRIYFLAGQTGFDANLITHRDIQIYDPAINTWTLASHQLPAGRSHTQHSVFYHRGKIVLFLGEVGHNTAVNTVWSIDPETLSTSVLGTFPDSRSSVAAGLLGDHFYVFGGYRGLIPGNAYVGTFS